MTKRNPIGTGNKTLLKYLGIPHRLHYLEECNSNDEPYTDDRFTIFQSNGKYTQLDQFETSYKAVCSNCVDLRDLRIWLPQWLTEKLRWRDSRTDYIELYDRFHPPFSACDYATKEYVEKLDLISKHARLLDLDGEQISGPVLFGGI